MLSACHVSGSEGRRRGDSLRNLFAPQLQSDERNSKNHWFLAAFLHPFAAVGKRVSRRSAKYPFGERTRSGPSGTPAPTSARRGGSERNVLGGAELSSPEAWQKEERAVGDVGPYECEKGGAAKETRAGARNIPRWGKYTGGGKKIVRSGKKILIFPVLSCKI